MNEIQLTTITYNVNRWLCDKWQQTEIHVKNNSAYQISMEKRRRLSSLSEIEVSW